MSRLDPNVVLARYHARHSVPHLACPICMGRKSAVRGQARGR